MKRFIAAIFALSTLAVGVGMATNYTMTQGAGTTFGSLVVSAVNYAQQLVCDPTTPTQCMAISASGQPTEANSAAILSAVQAAIPAGTNLIGKVGIDQTTPGTTNAVAVTAGTNLIGKVNLSATSTGGYTPLLMNNLLTTPNAIKASAGNLAKLYCYNPNASVAFVQVFNVASGSVTPGTTTPTNTYGIPATTIGGFGMSAIPDSYGTAISAIATTTATGGTPPSTGLNCNVSFN